MTEHDDRGKMEETDMLEHKALMRMLKERVVCVEFRKLNGNKRTMHCTLNPAVAPSVGPRRKRPARMITAYDVDQGGWRSFYSDRVSKAV